MGIKVSTSQDATGLVGGRIRLLGRTTGSTFVTPAIDGTRGAGYHLMGIWFNAVTSLKMAWLDQDSLP